jgi:hypothetical protein
LTTGQAIGDLSPSAIGVALSARAGRRAVRREPDEFRVDLGGSRHGPFPAGTSLAGSPNAAVLGAYAELDGRVNGTMETAEAALTAAGLRI